MLDDAGNLAAGNGDFFEDDGFQAANTAVFGDFFQGCVSLYSIIFSRLSSPSLTLSVP